MAWYYNTETGQLQQAHGTFGFLTSAGFEITELFGAGWHELSIPNTDTGAQAAAAAEKEFPKGVKPTYAQVTPENIAAAGVIGAATGQVATTAQTQSWSSGLTNLLANLANRNLWLRLAEGLLGIVLISVGLAHMTRAVPIATAIASKVP